MRKPLLVLFALLLALAPTPAGAAQGVVLVGCDLFAADGPRVAFVQSHGVARRNGKSRGQFFVGGANFRPADFAGRPCAEILSAVADDGLDFKAMNVFGRTGELGLWSFEQN
jgi:hypothetical protein